MDENFILRYNKQTEKFREGKRMVTEVRCDTGNLTLPRCGISSVRGTGITRASVTPILAVPFVHLLALPVSWWTDSLFPALAPQSVVAFADIAAVVVSCLMIMSFSGKIRNRKNKKLYVVMLGWIQYLY